MSRAPKIIFHEIEPQHHDCALNAARWMIGNPDQRVCGFRHPRNSSVRCDEYLYLAAYRTRKGTIIVRYCD